MKTLTLLFVSSLGVLFWSSAVAPAAFAADKRLADQLQFNRDIRPVLSAKCFQCHGPDNKKREADLRLDTQEGIDDTFLAGDMDHSEGWLRITSEDEDERMPPVSSHLDLTRREIDTIGRWIQQGAGWQGHWSFISPERPAPPAVQNVDWARNPIDAFILTRLESLGLSPAAEADRERLIRRVSFDLTGLPSTIDQIDEFLNDHSPDAYEKVVDRLLDSQRFGERMAVAWLDAARYGDSSVFHADGPRDMWPWRDWVINAYNSNLPFDQFTIEQLAGDLIPEATLAQKIASGFHRNNATTDEGGVIAEEFRVEYAVDRVKTTSMVWLGLTMECGQCHEHKYDPISQEEYYKFYAYFNQAADPGMQSRKGNQAPVVNVPDYRRQAELATIRQEIKRLDADLQSRHDNIGPDFEQWLAKIESQASSASTLPGDELLHLSLDEKEGGQVRDAVSTDQLGKVHGKPLWVDGRNAGGFQFDTSNFVDLGDVANFERTDSFSYGCWIKPPANASGAPIARMNDGNRYRGFDLHLSGGRVAAHIIHSWPDNAVKVTTKKALAKDKWQHVFVTYDGSSKASGITIYFDGKPQQWQIEADKLSGTTRAKVPLYLGRRNPGSPFRGVLDDVRIYSRQLSEAEVQSLAGHDPIGPILARPRSDRTEPEVATLRSHYLTNHDELYRRTKEELARLRAEQSRADKPVSTVMVMQDVPKMRMTYVLDRGHYASPKKDQPVQPGVPAALPPVPPGAEPNRLGLAKWLTQPHHPLTPRVAVNRYWSMLFGTGIVKTVEDFGSQGEWPSHPELLDWLAVDFVESGWNIKRTIKQMVMSSTYRQSAKVTRALYERDPENRLLARGPRFRLQGEFIRDNALSAGGLLVQRVGGPGVKPYQPPGLWNEVSLSGNVRFVQDKGEKLYRRSLYIYWKRSAPPPTMSIFDAPSREKCTIRRSRTNTPLQALVTLNDPQFVEAARALAERVMHLDQATLQQRITQAYRLAAGVRPKPAVLNLLTAAYQQELQAFSGQPQRAKELLGIGESPRDESLDVAEHAAMTIVASMILNLDETLTRG